MKRYRIINKFRFFVSLIIISVILSLILFTTIVDAKENTITSYIKVTVEKGDTLWKLASTYADNNTDIRDYIEEIITANNLKSVNIMPGQVISIPQNVNI